MDIKYLIENEYMKCVLQINGFSGPRPWVQSNRRVGSSRGGGGGGGGEGAAAAAATFILLSEPRFRRFYEFILHYVCHALHFHIK